MARPCAEYGALRLLLAFAMGCFVGSPPPAAAKSIDLYPAFGDFALRAPDAAQSAQSEQVYSQTGASPAWVVSQWNIAGSQLAAFRVDQEGGDEKIYTASAPAASVRIAQSPVGTDVTLQQNSAIVPCRTAGGRPWESDLFLSSTSHATGVIPGRPSPYLLSDIAALHEIVTVSVAATPAQTPKSCAVTMGGAVLAIVLQDFAVKPHQTLFYQLHLNRYCRNQPGEVCTMPWTKPLYYTHRNPYGCDDILSRVGQALLQNGVPRALDIDMLPGLRAAVAGAPPGMDRNQAHWSVAGGYIGQISWGDINVTSHWHGYRLLLIGD
jgi:hypothetical protein